jgi:Tol biopolymer transport system component
MTSFERFENRIPVLLEELAVPALPNYADDLFARTAATRQRPGWSFLERWLPMSAVNRRLAVAPRLPLRLGVSLALLIAAAIIGLLIAGSRLTRVPPPFGPASNGGIPYISKGNIYLGDTKTGTSRLLVDLPEDLGAPKFSPDGTRLLFLHVVPGVSPSSIVVSVAGTDGSGIKVVTPTPIDDADWKWIGWMPDSQRIGVIHPVDGVDQLDTFDASGNGSVQRIQAAAGLTHIAFRPPNGGQILFRAPREHAGLAGYGLYVMNADGSDKRLLVEPAVDSSVGDLDLINPTYSADGSRIFYNRWTGGPTQAAGGCCKLWVANADGSNQYQFVYAGAAWDGDASVSPDGKWVVFHHEPNDSPPHGVFFKHADGTGELIESGPPVTSTALFVWAPDSSKVLMFPLQNSDEPAYLLDPEGGPWVATKWRQENDLDWQRLALP